MIVRKLWTKVVDRQSLSHKTYKARYRVTCAGWFMFGVIPLYIREIEVEYLRDL